MTKQYYLPPKDVIRREIYQAALAQLKGAQHIRHEQCVDLAGSIADMAAAKAYAAIDEAKALRTKLARIERQVHNAKMVGRAFAKSLERIDG